MVPIYIGTERTVFCGQSGAEPGHEVPFHEAYIYIYSDQMAVH